MTDALLLEWKRWIIRLACGLLPLLCGCSAVQLGYNQGPMLAFWWLDGYVDINNSQRPRVRAALDDWFAWHRATQLPLYAQDLAALQALARGKVSAEQLCALVPAWQQHAERAVEQALPALAELALSLSPEQLQHLERHYADGLAEARRSHLQNSPAERSQAALARAVERAESLYGRLDEAQRRLLAQAQAASPFDAERWLNERAARQQDILRALRGWRANPPPVAVVQDGLRQLASQPLRSPRPEYRAYQVQALAAGCEQAARLHNSTSPAQRQKLVDKLKGWENDARSLVAPG